MTTTVSYSVRPIGFIRSDLKCLGDAPRQGLEGAPDTWLEVAPEFVEGLRGIVPAVRKHLVGEVPHGGEIEGGVRLGRICSRAKASFSQGSESDGQGESPLEPRASIKSFHRWSLDGDELRSLRLEVEASSWVLPPAGE